MSPPFVKLGEVVDVLSGFAFKSEFFDDSDGLPVVRIRDVVRGYTDTYYTGPYTAQFVVNDGDILIGMDGNFNAARWGGGRALLNQRVCKVTAKDSVLDEAYLFHYLPTVLKKIEDATPFVTVKHLSAGDLRDERIPLPPLPEQRRIAAILDKADALRTKRREALAQLDRLAQSIFVEMFGDPATNPKGWPERAMSELFETSPIFGTMIPPSVDGGEWLSLRVANIQDWRLDLTDQKFVTLPANMVERHSVMDGDLLLARAIASQEHLGKAVVATPSGRKWAFDSHLMRLRFNHAQALPEFVRHLWMTTGGRSLFLKATRRSAVQFNINTKEMNSLVLPMPPVQLQREFVNRVLALDSIRQKQNLGLVEFDALFATLQHRAFRGEL